MLRVILIVLFLIGCSENIETRNYAHEGNIVHVKYDLYKIILRPDTFPNSNVTLDATLTEEFDPPLKKLRIPVSIQGYWEFKTEECGTLEFYEAITGHIICFNCRINANTYHNSCPSMFRAVNDLDWAIYD